MNASDETLTGTTLMILLQDVGNNETYAGANAIRLNLVPEPASATLAILSISMTSLRRRR